MRGCRISIGAAVTATAGRRRSASGRARTARLGFTLIETALATIIVGVGVLAIVAAQQAFHKQNAWSTHAAIATYLGNEIREMTLNLPRHDPVTGSAIWGPEEGEATLGLVAFDDLDDFDNAYFTSLATPPDEPNGPVNARREIIPNMQGWAQLVQVDKVKPNDIRTLAASGEPYLIRMTVIVTYKGPYDDEPVEMTRVSWIAPD